MHGNLMGRPLEFTITVWFWFVFAVRWVLFGLGTAVVLIALWLLFSGTVAVAQPAAQTSQTQTYTAFTLLARTADLSATTTSGSTLATISTVGPVAMVCNVGSVFAYVRLGIAGLTVSAANGVPVPPNSCITMNAAGATRAAAITATSTATVQIAIGTGAP